MNLQDNAKTIIDQYGVDPKEGLSLNAYQSVLVSEAEIGTISEDELNKSIQQLEENLNFQKDPKLLKEETKRLENLKKVATREVKEINMDLENKWSSYFPEVDNLINSLDNKSKKQILSNVYINENPKWHPERNSLVHIKIVTSRGLSTGDNDLIEAALFHDIAKFDTVSFGNTGWPTSHLHDVKGAESAKRVGKNNVVVYICQNHMRIKGWQADSEGGVMNPSTKYSMFNEAPGNDYNEKAKSFWKLCVFSKMDNMTYDFDAKKLKWDNPSYDNWDLECPLKDLYKKSELVEVKVEKPKVEMPFTSKEVIDFGAKGPQIGQINREIIGKSKEEAFEIIKNILGNPDLKIESNKWIMTFERFRNKI